jgi:hypothetical protein
VATLEQLSAEQRAIIELVLQRGTSYPELSDMLGMPETRVRELARDALVELAPSSAAQVDAEWRGQLADYILGQQAGPESSATRGHLRRSEAARAWARSLLDSLHSLYGETQPPSIPDAERGRRRRAAPSPSDAAEGAPLARRTRVRTPVERRRLLFGAGGLAVLALIVLVWPVGALTGGGGNDKKTSAVSGSANVAACPSKVTSVRKGAAAGLALAAQRSGRKQLIVQAAGLQPNTIKNKRPQDAYEVWLYNSPSDARAIGAQVTDTRGNYQGAGPLPANYRRYACIDVSKEPLDRNQAHSRQSVLRGRLKPFKEPPANVAKNKPILLERIILTPPPQ